MTVRKPPLDFLFTESLDVPSSSNDFDQESYETDSQATANVSMNLIYSRDFEQFAFYHFLNQN